MAKEVIGRKAEKAKLEDILQTEEAAFLAVYGRRRVGKTFLIRQYLSKDIVFDFSGEKDASLSQQMENFFDQYLKRTGGASETTVPKDWAEAFRYLFNYLLTIPYRKRKYVVFLDEMPWMDGPRSGFISALDFFWNQNLSKLDDIVLIACGSSTSWIKKNLIHASGGLYNRITHRMKLNPFTLAETEQFFKKNNLSLERQIITELYMIVGGIPHYLKEVKKNESVAKIIEQLCFNPDGLLYDEYSQLYTSLFTNSDYHIKVVEALANHHYGLSQSKIVLKTKLPQSTVSRVLEELTECDFITKCMPFEKKRKEAIYRLTDPYSLFYNKFMKSNRSNLAGKWSVIAASQAYKSWSGYAYENVCLTHINQITNALGISGISSSVNSWFFEGDETYPGAQIDMLIDRNDKCVNLCEIKYTQDRFAITKDYASKLQLKRSVFSAIASQNKTPFIILITVNPPLKNSYYDQLIQSTITANDLYKL
jgi:uncharacterized protein